MKRFTCYATIKGDLVHVAVTQSSLDKAFRDAKAHSVRHGESWLYDASTGKMVAHFLGGALDNPRRFFKSSADAERYIKQARRHQLDVTPPAFDSKYGLYHVHVSKKTDERMETLHGRGKKVNPFGGKMPTLKQLKARSIGSAVGGGYIAQFSTRERAEFGKHILEEWGGLIVSDIKISPSTGDHLVFFEPDFGQRNPKYRLGQRRIYTVKGKRAPRYKGSLPSRQTTFTSHRKAVAASNPRGVKIYGKLIRIEAQKTQKHVCDAECKKANHCYFHDFTSGPSIYGMPDGSLIIR